MIDLLLLLAALIGVSLLALTCCGPPNSSRLSCNQSSQDGAMHTALDGGDTHGSRKITVIEAENVNHDVKSRQERTLEEERKELRRRKARERVARKRCSTNRSNQELPNQRSRSRADRDASEKKDEKGSGKRKESDRAPSSDQTSKQSKQRDVSKEKDHDESTKDCSKEQAGGGHGSKTPLDGSTKGSKMAPAPSTERIGTNETMMSRERQDEVESTKLKREREAAIGSPKTPLVVGQTQVETGESEKKKKPKSPPPRPPKRRLSKKKEEEVRIWNEAIARGNVFRPRKDDETIDEVNVDWNA